MFLCLMVLFRACLLASKLFFHFLHCRCFVMIELSLPALPSPYVQVPPLLKVSLQDISYLMSVQSPQPGSLFLCVLQSTFFFCSLSNSSCSIFFNMTVILSVHLYPHQVIKCLKESSLLQSLKKSMFSSTC